VTEQVVALLRGINVGKAKRVAMADLRALLSGLGFQAPRTLLNSGNAVFGCPPDRLAGVAEEVRSAIADRLGVDCAVLARTATEVAEVLAADPLRPVVTDPSRYLVGFLFDRPARPVVDELHAMDFGAEQLRVLGSAVYFWCPDGIQNSAAVKAAGSRLGVEVTTRNWNTVLKLAELAGAG